MMGFSASYMLFMLPAMLLAVVATIVTKATFSKYMRYRAGSGLTGAQAARRLLDSAGLDQVDIEETSGFLSDHYDPTSRKLRLSPDVYRSPSLSAVGVACHEAGHALQHAEGYAALGLRSALVPIAQFGSNMSYLCFMLGAFMGLLPLLKLGVILFTGVVLFSLITLPVEWDASARAKRLMVESGVVAPGEEIYAGRVLNAAFLTYVASAVTALMTLLYYLLRLGLIGGNRND